MRVLRWLPLWLAVVLMMVGCQGSPNRVPEIVRIDDARILPAGLEGMKEIRQASWYQFEALKALEEGYGGSTLEERIVGFDRAIMLFSLTQERYEAAVKLLDYHLRPAVEQELEAVQEILVDCYRHRPIEAVLRSKSSYANHPLEWYANPPLE